MTRCQIVNRAACAPLRAGPPRHPRRSARRASGLECTPQDFRHSYVSNLSASGIDVADLADISGHSVETAQQRYRHALGRSFEQVRQTIG